MPLLLKTPAEVKKHWHAVAGTLQSILPASGGQYRASFEYTVAALICGNFPGETAKRYGGTMVPVVPLIETTEDDLPEFWLSWHEEWTDPVVRQRGKLQFGQSAITVYFGKPSTPKKQLLRAEWAGVKRIEADQDVFPAPGAAHPHWHVDGVGAYFSELSTLLEGFRLGDDSNAIANELVQAVPNNRELCWTGVHLAASSHWADQPWPGPAGPHDTHARGPSELIQLRQWLSSCVKYLQAQIQDQ